MSARCYVPGGTWADEDIALDRETSHHLARVLRVKTGEAVELFNGVGDAAEAEVTEVKKQAVRVRPLRRWSTPRPIPDITLVQSLIRPQPMDYVLRKATELGVSSVQPVLTERCVARTQERPDRWAKTIISAAEQCGANWLPEVRPVCGWADVLAGAGDYDCVLLCALTQDAKPLRDILRAQGAVRRVAAWVGPEGDFTPEELRAALGTGAVPVSLGSLTLRAETASLYVMAALRYEFG